MLSDPTPSLGFFFIFFSFSVAALVTVMVLLNEKEMATPSVRMYSEKFQRALGLRAYGTWNTSLKLLLFGYVH